MSGAVDITYKFMSLSEIKQDIKISDKFWATLEDAKNQLCKDLSKVIKQRVIFKKDEIENILRKDFGYENDKICSAVSLYNSRIDWVLRYGMSLLVDETNETKQKFTKTLSPRNFDRVKFMLSTFTIPQDKWNTEIWRGKIENIFDLLTKDKKITDIEMDSLPKFTNQQAYDLIWYLQEALAIIPKEDKIQPSLCSECDELFYSYEEGNHCDNCGTAFCSNCYDNCSDCGCCSECCKCEGKDK